MGAKPVERVRRTMFQQRWRNVLVHTAPKRDQSDFARYFSTRYADLTARPTKLPASV